MVGFQQGNQYIGPGEVQSTTVTLDRPTSGSYPVFRFPSPGFVHSAVLFANVTTSGSQLIQAQVANAGTVGAGTILVAQPNSGTLVAGSAYSLVLSASVGSNVFNTGELAVVGLTTNVAVTDVAVQIDYVLNAA